MYAANEKGSYPKLIRKNRDGIGCEKRRNASPPISFFCFFFLLPRSRRTFETHSFPFSFLFPVTVTSIKRRLGCPPSTIGMEASRLVPVEARLFRMAGRQPPIEKAKPTSSSE